MTTLHLDDRVAASLTAQAAAQGMTLDAYLQAIAQTRNMGLSPIADFDYVQDFDAALNQLFAEDTRPLPATSFSYGRQDIYVDRD